MVTKKKSASPKKTADHGVTSPLVGRTSEMRKILACLSTNRSILLEGPVGVGKTHLALSATEMLGRKVFRIDGDNRYTEQKLTGWFDPPAVMKKGFTADAFIEGPLLSAMRSGGILFINELNRLPEGVQNVLLPALDEKMISLPKIGVVYAKPEFLVIATQNPKEFVATSHLSEAILDRFELLSIGYQTEAEEFEVVHSRMAAKGKPESGADLIAQAAVRLVRKTRNHAKIRRGASIRAALAISELTVAFMEKGSKFKAAFLDACSLALPTRIEIEREGASEESLGAEIAALLAELASDAVSSLNEPDEKKKS